MLRVLAFVGYAFSCLTDCKVPRWITVPTRLEAHVDPMNSLFLFSPGDNRSQPRIKRHCLDQLTDSLFNSHVQLIRSN